MSKDSRPESEANSNRWLEYRGPFDHESDITECDEDESGSVDTGTAPDGCINDLDQIPSLKDLIIDWLLQSVVRLLPPRKPF